MKLGQKIALAAGVLLLGWLVYRIGPGTLWAQLSQLSWGFLLLLGVHVFTVLFNTLGWRCTLPPAARGIPLHQLAGMLIVGEAVNTLTPAAVVGGDLMRASLLGRRISLVEAVGSVGQVAMAQFMSQALFVLTGVPVVLTVIPEGGLRVGLAIFSAVLVGVLGLLLYLGWKPEGLSWIRRRCESVRWFRERWTAPGSRWRALADETLGALRTRPRDYAAAVGFAFLAWQTGAVEVFLVLRLLHAPVSWKGAFVIEVLTVALEGATFFVPAKMGTQEGGQYLIFLALGLDPVKGVTLGFVRRLRAITWAVAGLAVLGTHRAGRAQAPLPRPSDSTPR